MTELTTVEELLVKLALKVKDCPACGGIGRVPNPLPYEYGVTPLLVDCPACGIDA